MNHASPLLQLEHPKGFVLLDEKLSTGQAESGRLFIHLSNGAVTLALRENKSGQFIGAECIVSTGKALHTLVEEVRQAVAESSIIRLNQHSSCRIAIANAFHTLVPAGLYHPGDEERLLRLAVSRNDLEPLIDDINAWGIKVIHGIQPELYSLLRQLFPAARICNAITCNLEYQLSTAARSRGTMMQLTCHPELLSIIVSEGKKLLFTNSFPLKDMGEAAYFTMFVCEQLDLDASTLPIELNGTSHSCEIVRTRLEPYCHQLTSTAGLFNAELSYKLKSVPPSGLLPALSVALCE